MRSSPLPLQEVGVVAATAEALAAAAVEAATASKRPAGNVSGLIGSSQSALNCGTKEKTLAESHLFYVFFFSLLINEMKKKGGYSREASVKGREGKGTYDDDGDAIPDIYLLASAFV